MKRKTVRKEKSKSKKEMKKFLKREIFMRKNYAEEFSIPFLFYGKENFIFWKNYDIISKRREKRKIIHKKDERETEKVE